MPADGHTQPRPDFFDTARQIVEDQQARHDRHRCGVSWSGLTTPLDPVETVEAVAERLLAEHERREAFFVTPRGRFMIAVNSLGALGYAEASTLHSLYSRSLADEREPLNTDAVGRAIRILNEINHSAAREGVGALVDLLAPPLVRTA